MRLFNRDILAELKPFFGRKEAILIRGMRRVGKTTLLKLIGKELLRDKKVKKEQIYFFDLEDLDLREDFNQSPENVLKYLDSGKRKKYIFIDEIQYLDNPSNFLKILVDHYSNLKFFATGSSSLEIKSKIQDSLVGRVLYFQLYPLNFSEFLRFKKAEKLKPKKILTERQNKKMDLLLDEYLVFGGMPEIVLENNVLIKKKLLKSYLNLYITKDIRSLTEIRNPSIFNRLTKILASQVGNILVKNDVANRLNANLKIINRYLDILEYTFVVILLKPYFSNTVSQLVKSEKIFFYDLGLRNALLNDFNSMEFRVDKGAVFENFIFLQLVAKFDLEEISYYRTQQGSEIDFVIDSEKQKMAVEVKYAKFKNRKSFRVFDTFDDFDNYVVNLNFETELKNYKFVEWKDFLVKLRS